MVVMDGDLEGAIEKAADMTGIAKRQVRADLERFETMIEGRGNETGAWRGTIERDAS